MSHAAMGLCAVVAISLAASFAAVAADRGDLRAAVVGAAPTVASNERAVGADELHAIAARALERALKGRANRFEFDKADERLSFTVVDAESTELVARTIDPAVNLSPRMTVWVDVKRAGRTQKTLLVPVRVAAYRLGWVSLRDLSAGTHLSADILREQEVDIAAGGHPAWQGDPEGLVLRSPVLAGRYLVAGQAVAQAPVFRGAVVQVVHRAGGVEVQTSAHALQDGEVGQNIQVRVSANQPPLLARVTAAGQVELVK
jgi:flagella basal body P-ring formation protein FlgA